MQSSNPRIFIGPIEVSGIYTKLEDGFSKIGVSADFHQLYDHPFNYGNNKNRKLISGIACSLNRKMHSKSRTTSYFATISYLMVRILIFPYFVLRYQVYIFTWGESLLPFGIDLPILKKLNKRTISIIGHGSEARPPYLSRIEYLDQTSLATILEKRTRKIAKKIRFIERWSSVVVGLSTTDHFLSKPYLNFLKLGLPSNPVVFEKATSDLMLNEVRILHAPSKSEIKGSTEIRQIMTRICSKYPQVKFIEVSNKSNAEVLSAIADSDLVIDQLYSDIPIAAIGVEAGSLAVPCIISIGSIEFWHTKLNRNQFPPSILCNTESIEATIEKYILDVNLRKIAGDKIYEFLQDHWTCEAVASRYLEVVEERISSDFFETPGEFVYMKGCGISPEVATMQVNVLVQKYGINGLKIRNLSSNSQVFIE